MDFPKVLDLIRTAAFVSREVRGSEELKNEQADVILYVFDTDIIVTACAPWRRVSATGFPQPGYGDIFLDKYPGNLRSKASEFGRKFTENPTSAEIISSIIANYAINLTSKQNYPIFQLPSHAQETTNVYRAVRRRVEQYERTDKRKSALRTEFDQARLIALVREYVKDPEKITEVNRAIENIIDIVTFQGHSRSRQALQLREWDNYFSIENKYGGIFSISDSPYFLEGRDKRYTKSVSEKFKLLTDEEAFKKSPQYTRVFNYWDRVLNRTTRFNTSVDASAMADLSALNYYLKDSFVRCVFITGDLRITRGAYNAPSFSDGEGPDQRKPSSFVRHLWSFFGDALLDTKEPRSVIDIFSGLLAPWGGSARQSNSNLELLAASEKIKYSVTNDDINKATDQWTELTGKAVANFKASEIGTNESLRDEIRKKLLVVSADKNWRELRDVIAEEVDRARDRTSLAMSDIGVDEIIRASRLGFRNPPELIFDSLEHTNKIFQKLSRAGGYSSVDEFETDFMLVKEDCHNSSCDGDDRQESHLKFLVLGAAFASAGKWLVARSHARRAISIVERSRMRNSDIPVKDVPDNPQFTANMSGREALFLTSVCTRIMATDQADLNEALRYLIRAEGCLRLDHVRGTSPTIGYTRFDNERLALRLSAYYLRRYGDKSDFADDEALLAYEAAQPVASAIQKRKGIRSGKNIPVVTLVNGATNIIQCYVIHEFRSIYRGDEDETFLPISREVLLNAVECIEEHARDIPPEQGDLAHVSATVLMQRYAGVGRLFLSGEKMKRTKRNELIDELFGNPSQANVTNYDEWRYESLKNFVRDTF